jgi:hypothetical protein
MRRVAIRRRITARAAAGSSARHTSKRSDTCTAPAGRAALAMPSSSVFRYPARADGTRMFANRTPSATWPARRVIWAPWVAK